MEKKIHPLDSICSLASDSARTSEIIPTRTAILHPVTSLSVINLSLAFNRNGSRNCQARKFKSTISSGMALNPTAKRAKKTPDRRQDGATDSVPDEDIRKSDRDHVFADGHEGIFDVQTGHDTPSDFIADERSDHAARSADERSG
jgi:hypothetical protein